MKLLFSFANSSTSSIAVCTLIFVYRASTSAVKNFKFLRSLGSLYQPTADFMTILTVLPQTVEKLNNSATSSNNRIPINLSNLPWITLHPLKNTSPFSTPKCGLIMKDRSTHGCLGNRRRNPSHYTTTLTTQLAPRSLLWRVCTKQQR